MPFSPAKFRALLEECGIGGDAARNDSPPLFEQSGVAGSAAGGFFVLSGLNVSAALAHVKEKRVLAGWTGGPSISSAELLVQPCDVLVPAALGGVISRDNASALKCRIVVEGANGPTTPEADDILKQRGITILPDIYANAGGVTVSYFEWVQNIQQFAWDETRVRLELERIMRASFGHLTKAAAVHRVDLRTAAFVVAIERVARAMAQRGI